MHCAEKSFLLVLLITTILSELLFDHFTKVKYDLATLTKLLGVTVRWSFSTGVQVAIKAGLTEYVTLFLLL